VAVVVDQVKAVLNHNQLAVMVVLVLSFSNTQKQSHQTQTQPTLGFLDHQEHGLHQQEHRILII